MFPPERSAAQSDFPLHPPGGQQIGHRLDSDDRAAEIGKRFADTSLAIMRWSLPKSLIEPVTGGPIR
ncbi:hypothetical protein GV794_09255 [Nocardia cyriacigeorgica]|uniref:Uncharacterized protein n=1 Tax=Nocardia cyriacigeorgica TaxID=135487 RepID=A0A6P1D8H4_9NOCA|nr:hypothetical protein [Nocardia cyriacigeorgica]NEW46767.1 hypothetical protein [Nocardia cyriacigeorgica]NEW52046.1 hypothetical protein [Nocardia cyriacigeorgica]NEW55839.1 hypothetical protein [Nocardia cyriacigeorgica]